MADRETRDTVVVSGGGGSSASGVILGVVVIILVLVGIWFFLLGGNGGGSGNSDTNINVTLSPLHRVFVWRQRMERAGLNCRSSITI